MLGFSDQSTFPIPLDTGQAPLRAVFVAIRKNRFNQV